MSLGILIALVTTAYGYDVAPYNVYSNGYLISGEDRLPSFVTVSDLVIRDTKVNDDPEIWWHGTWEKFTIAHYSIDIRDRPYIPIDLLVSWNHPYIINYTVIHGYTLYYGEGYYNNCTLRFNDLYDVLTMSTMYNDVEWHVSYIGNYVILEE